MTTPGNLNNPNGFDKFGRRLTAVAGASGMVGAMQGQVQLKQQDRHHLELLNQTERHHQETLAQPAKVEALKSVSLEDLKTLTVPAESANSPKVDKIPVFKPESPKNPNNSGGGTGSYEDYLLEQTSVPVCSRRSRERREIEKQQNEAYQISSAKLSTQVVSAPPLPFNFSSERVIVVQYISLFVFFLGVQSLFYKFVEKRFFSNQDSSLENLEIANLRKQVQDMEIDSKNVSTRLTNLEKISQDLLDIQKKL